MTPIYSLEFARRERAIRRLVLAIDLGETPDAGNDAQAAIEAGYIEIETDSADRWDYVLTDRGIDAPMRWRNDDSNGGDAA